MVFRRPCESWWTFASGCGWQETHGSTSPGGLSLGMAQSVPSDKDVADLRWDSNRPAREWTEADRLSDRYTRYHAARREFELREPLEA